MTPLALLRRDEEQNLGDAGDDVGDDADDDSGDDAGDDADADADDAD